MTGHLLLRGRSPSSDCPSYSEGQMADQLFEGGSRERGLSYASPYDAFGVVGAWVELVSRQMRRTSSIRCET